MSPRLLIENTPFILTAEQEELHNHTLYQAVKKEIYRERSPFAGGTDWELVKQNSEQLAQVTGLDLAMCVYYSIACLKLDGLRGYTNGLELMYGCLVSLKDEIKESDKYIERLFHWANAQALIELQNLRASYEILRELYRCEQLCDRISYLLQSERPGVKADFESIGYIIFEQIDRLETCYQVALKRREFTENGRPAAVVQVTKPGTSWWKLALMFVLGGALAGGGVYWWLLQTLGN
ncbi:type VI secretion system ImpA family N-terminal domain-containing protein [Vibrio gazogenes]|uniref:ImpA, N-terminal, type VI secretion system n=1 Tax=Vibrio gazogenes DSM 21264 = NBRC 103151 TaxID=1123492 RepID=A0A1M5GYH8_VIBGA|nr:type VI secretion system ImpA family N-terminal domain-containing protein [Vibrio gazogenes]USP15780.1 type VI secretion system ImpA family N-terminal domain-containing protein [Vibrio gazogenes]SHG08791.1 ImpA, N-terminal, type VI secretion system [Vibrio gazogenes DSM 21264] [Vibrio gazogenes DSM 21264 = NBRC 103151]SJN52766.1 hypothetical protein BQ6471_00061 [Vibrio gazogenes]